MKWIILISASLYLAGCDRLFYPHGYYYFCPKDNITAYQVALIVQAMNQGNDAVGNHPDLKEHLCKSGKLE